MWKYAGVACGMLLAMGAAPGPIMAEDAVVVTIQISPATINLAQKGTWVTVHADIAYSDVVLDSEAVLSLNGIPVDWTQADNQGNLVAKFCVDKVKGIVAEPSATLTLAGEMDTPEGRIPFSGTEEVRVIDQGGKR